MKHLMKRTVSLLMAAAILCSLCVTAFAGSTIKCYTIKTGNTTVFSNSNLSSRSGSIYDTDEIIVLSVTDKYCYVQYPITNSKGAITGYKKGYIATSAILVDTTGPSYKSTGKFTTYIRSGGKVYGYVAAGDSVKILGTYGNYTQIKYPVSGGYKYAMAATSDVQKYLTGTTPSSSVRFPLKGSIVRCSSATTNGIYCDYQASSGTPVYAPANGTVQFMQSYSTTYKKLASYGNNILFTSSDGIYKIRMAHLSSFNGVTLSYKSSLSYPCSASKYNCKTITLATRSVKQGDLLGYTGMTGNASGPHLHLEVQKNGSAVTPASVLTTW